MRINRMQRFSGLVVACLSMTAAAFAGVSISSPSSGATVGSPVHFVASASAGAPISAMRIYVDNSSMYTVQDSSLDTYLSLGNGGHDVVIVAWDSNGNPYSQEETITVSGSSGSTGGGGGGSGVSISSPSAGSTVGAPVHVVASATFGGSASAMRIYLDGNNMYTVNASSIDTYVNAGTGSHDLAVVAWDNNGNPYKQEFTFTVGSSSGGGGGGGGSGSGVSISSPASGATVSSPFQVTASASASASISAMRVYLDGNDMYTVSSNQLNTSVSASSGTHDLAVVAWDSNGTAYKQEYNISVSGSSGGGGGGGGSPAPSGATTFWEIQQMSGWGSCTVCAGAGGSGPAASYWTSQGVSSPSLSGSSMQFHISGSTPYSDVLWWKDLTPDDNATNYKYDVDFYITNPQYAQALEFDVNVNVGNAGTYFIFGTQCDIGGGGQFDVWDTAGNTWVPTGAWCGRPSAYTWHHLTWEFTRTNSQATFVAVTLDGNKQYINYTFWGKQGSWPAINVAFQMDGDANMDAYSVWLDNVTLSYW